MRLTQEQFEKLQPYEKDLMNAYKKSFVHVSGTDFLKIAQIYDEVFEQPLTTQQKGCNTCRLNALRKLGELYVMYQKEDTKKEEKKDTKKGRPKKLTE